MKFYNALVTDASGIALIELLHVRIRMKCTGDETLNNEMLGIITFPRKNLPSAKI